MAHFFPILNSFIVSLQTIHLQADPADGEFNLFLFTLLILGLIFIFISIIAAIVLAVLCLLIIFGCIGIGALSASVLIGISKKSFTTGFRWFVIIFSSLSLSLTGAGAFWFFNRITHWFSYEKAIIAGAVIGLISGVIAGICFAYIIRKVSTALKEKLEKRKLANNSFNH
ncbi:MAG: hypothetical protein QM710_13925 [Flavobacterium sp.]